jgi:beta-galactosidase/beta-glucuronidase
VVAFGETGIGSEERIKQWKNMARLDRSKSRVLPLSNEWRFKPDPDEVGVGEQWFAPGADDSGWAVVRSDKECGWEKQGFEGYVGVGWYRQEINVPADMGDAPCVGLYFSAVDEEAEVYINGSKAFDHTTAATKRSARRLLDEPFSFDAKPFIRPGEANVVAVRVMSKDGRGGVWRPAYLAGSDQKPESEEFRVAVRLVRQ